MGQRVIEMTEEEDKMLYVADEVVMKAFNGKLPAEVLEYAKRMSHLMLQESDLLSKAGDAKKEMEKYEVDLRIAVVDEQDERGKPKYSNETRRNDEVEVRLRTHSQWLASYKALRHAMNRLSYVRAELEFLKNIIAISRLYDVNALRTQ